MAVLVGSWLVCSALPVRPPWPELQATPTMGYNGWLAATTSNEPGARNQSLYYNIVDRLSSSGLAAAGYDTLLAGVCIGWVRDSVTKKLEAPKETWPDGFKALVDYAHSKGLKVGAYTDTGPVGCCHPAEIGSYGHEQLDIQQFADWGVDHIAVDNCGAARAGHPRSQSVFEYAKIHAALVKVGRPMVYGVWNIGAGKEWAWASKLGHYWRTSSDVGNRSVRWPPMGCVRARRRLTPSDHHRVAGVSRMMFRRRETRVSSTTTTFSRRSRPFQLFQGRGPLRSLTRYVRRRSCCAPLFPPRATVLCLHKNRPTLVFHLPPRGSVLFAVAEHNWDIDTSSW